MRTLTDWSRRTTIAPAESPRAGSRRRRCARRHRALGALGSVPVRSQSGDARFSCISHRTARPSFRFAARGEGRLADPVRGRRRGASADRERRWLKAGSVWLAFTDFALSEPARVQFLASATASFAGLVKRQTDLPEIGSSAGRPDRVEIDLGRGLNRLFVELGLVGASLRIGRCGFAARAPPAEQRAPGPVGPDTTRRSRARSQGLR